MTTPHNGTRWAYAQVYLRTSLRGKTADLDELNRAGAEGWEAFATIHATGSDSIVLLRKAY